MKKRADQLLLELGLCETKQQAQLLIMAGKVRANKDHVIQKSNQMFDSETILQVIESSPYVSRGAYKLKAGIDLFQPNLNDKVALDVGASTGGFSDLLLQCGVRKIYAVDSGYGQLHGKLRNDKRVINLERTNARKLDKTMIDEEVDIIVADVSFISLKKVLPAAAQFLKKDGWVMILIKPQFEAKRHEVPHGGVITDPQLRQCIVDDICNFCQTEFAWKLQKVIPSPIKGPKGNQEYCTVFRAE